jgi:hypothetical protein
MHSHGEVHVSVGDWLKRTFGGGKSDRPAAPPPVSDERRAQVAAWFDALRAGEFNIPDNVHDKAGWDTYWRNQAKYGAIQQGFDDVMSSDPSLIEVLDRRGVRTVLCAGIGLSTEALSLALHGFDVTALDISDVPFVFVRRRLSSGPLHLLPGFATRNDDVFVMPALTDEGQGPNMHRSPARPMRAGGSLRLVVGDIVDPAVCPGPFDAIVERRTIQLFPEAERTSALERLAARLAPRALFVSHEHNGRARPDDTRGHYATAWIRANGFVVDAMPDAVATPDRLAQLRYSTG